MEGRGVSLDLAAQHQVGALVPITHGTKPFLTWAKRYWPTWGGLLFPLRDPLGGLTGFQLRRLPSALEPGQNVYTDFTLTSAHPRVFGLADAMPHVWQSQRVVLVEGVFDYFGVRVTGTQDVVANLTANVAGPMRRFLARYARLVVALLDTDPTGRSAAVKLQAMGQEDGFLVTAPMYHGKDIGALLQTGQLHPLQTVLAKHVVLKSPP